MGPNYPGTGVRRDGQEVHRPAERRPDGGSSGGHEKVKREMKDKVFVRAIHESPLFFWALSAIQTLANAHQADFPEVS